MFQSKKDIAKSALRDAILLGQYKPGQYLRQNDIAADLSLSSTPVREAFAELQVTGLLVHEAHRGFRVASLDAERIRQIYQARKIIEIETACLAVPRISKEAISELDNLLMDMTREPVGVNLSQRMMANDSFHRTLFEASANPFLVEAIERLWNSFPRFLPWTIESRQQASLEEHKTILAAIKKRDVASVAEAYETQHSNAMAVFLKLLENAENTD